jgi:hypothetical protein
MGELRNELQALGVEAAELVEEHEFALEVIEAFRVMLDEAYADLSKLRHHAGDVVRTWREVRDDLTRERKEVSQMGQKTVVFEFDLNQRVKTALGDVGIIEDCDVSFGDVQKFYVFTGKTETSRWYAAGQLSLAE